LQLDIGREVKAKKRTPAELDTPHHHRALVSPIAHHFSNTVEKQILVKFPCRHQTRTQRIKGRFNLRYD
jgi:hypothetical protein